MNKIYIWGAGKFLEYIYPTINREMCLIEGIIDGDITKQGMLWDSEVMIYSPQRLCEQDFDYIIISTIKYEEIETECRRLNIPENKVISYWKDSRSEGLFESRPQRIIKECNGRKILENRLESAPYEWGLRDVPQIKSGEELLKKIIIDKSSLSRFGDGEFDTMRGKARPWFQEYSTSLKDRLIEVINSDIPSLNIAIAENFSHMERYKEEAADLIRNFMAHGTRDEIMNFLVPGKIYYDAYVSRPYIIYKSKENAKKIFDLFKNIWKDRNLLLVEGQYGRMGIGNDLLSGAKSVKRIICPSTNVWNYYDEILDQIENIVRADDLICISLGPTATVLAFDLARKGFQALDIGQLDNEYEWFIRNVESRVPIPGKMVAEVSENVDLDQFKSMEYSTQIVSKIG